MGAGPGRGLQTQRWTRALTQKRPESGGRKRARHGGRSREPGAPAPPRPRYTARSPRRSATATATTAAPPMRLLPLLGECPRPGRPGCPGPAPVGDRLFPRWNSHAECVWPRLQGELTQSFSGCFSPWPFNSGVRYSVPRGQVIFLFLLGPSHLFIPADKVLKVPDFDLSSHLPPRHLGNPNH